MNGKRVMKTKQPVALVALLVLLCCTVAGTLAYLVDKTPEVKNTFEPAKVTTSVLEDPFDGVTKKNVRIKNTGNIPAYIRAAVIINWADAQGNVYGGATPEAGTDYKIDYNKSDWFQGSDGYYYCKTAVKSVKQDASGCYTPVLINSCYPVEGKAPEGYDLQVTILADGIQSVPADAVEEAWPAIQVDNNGNLTAKD